MFPLTGVNIGKEDYVTGPLEDWTKGALRLNGKDQYAVCPDKALNDTFSYRVNSKTDETGKPLMIKVKGKDFKSPQVYDSNFLIEAYFRTEPGATNGVIIEKMKGAGYSIEVNEKGGVTFSISDGKGKARLNSEDAVNDGRWHHMIAETDRSAERMTIYIDGKKNAEGEGIKVGSSIANSSDLFVGGTPEGRNLKGTFEFMRICLGTLKDAKTDIDELYAWEFDGPFLKDFTGRYPTGKRDAGALEK